MDSLLPSVKNLLEPPFDATLANLYNTRQEFYTSLRLPANSKDLKGTLFWEFGKALSAVYADMNPVAVTMTASFGVMLLDLVDEVLRSVRIIKGKR